jgi:ferredoxin
MRIEVDRDVCCGSGNCVMTVPAVFDQADADGLVLLLDPSPPADLYDAVRRAAHICPSGAIHVD